MLMLTYLVIYAENELGNNNIERQHRELNDIYMCKPSRKGPKECCSYLRQIMKVSCNAPPAKWYFHANSVRMNTFKNIHQPLDDPENFMKYSTKLLEQEWVYIYIYILLLLLLDPPPPPPIGKSNPEALNCHNMLQKSHVANHDQIITIPARNKEKTLLVFSSLNRIVSYNLQNEYHV